ncbi:MAG: hypothetical protein WCT49_01270 [Candidatus Paceibacterota bacterium]|jgi:hypothetical protein|nr:hypothetical protein [Candidatus Paceibacterota bacterium]
MDKHRVRIKKEQRKDGSFSDQSGAPSLITSAIVLSFLDRSKNSEELKAEKSKTARFLVSQRSADGKLSKNIGENFYALSAIAEYDKELIDGEWLAQILNILVALESQEGGPYYSELPSKGKKKNDIDPVTNASILRFLSAFGVELPNLAQYSEMLDTAEKIAEAFRVEMTPAVVSAKELYLHSLEKNINASLALKSGEIVFNEGEQAMVDKIMAAAERRFSALSPELRSFARQCIKNTMRGNTDKQMSLMSYYMKQALGKKAKKIPDELIAEMGLANIFFWTAFIIYDDFWDEDEAADPHILPTANLFARSYVELFSTVLPAKTGFAEFFRKLMDDLDGANTWETMHCRTKVSGSEFTIPDVLPDYARYENKYRPASGHILGPVAMLVNMGYPIDSAEVKHLIAYFKNYLIAMQLNDDAHDWEEDMARGHLSTVVVLMLADLKASGWKKPVIDLVADREVLKKIFWFSTLKKYAKLAKAHAKLARKALSSLEMLEDEAPLLHFITITEKAAIEAEREQKKSEMFLNSYKNKI